MAKKRNKLTNNKQVEHYKKATEDESTPDEQNPVSVVQVFPAELLLKIALGELDMKPFVIHELKSRGLDDKGKWVGFDQAKTIWEKRKHVKTKQVRNRNGKHR